jgi:hypothetical protein
MYAFPLPGDELFIGLLRFSATLRTVAGPCKCMGHIFVSSILHDAVAIKGISRMYRKKCCPLSRRTAGL